MRFSLPPNALIKISKNYLNALEFEMKPTSSNNVSSMNNVWLIVLVFYMIFSLSIWPSSALDYRDLLKHSIIRKKRGGDKGKPYFMDEKKFVGPPLIIIMKQVLNMNPSTHSIHCLAYLNYLRILNMNLLLICSKALAMSNFSNMDFILLHLIV